MTNEALPTLPSLDSYLAMTPQPLISRSRATPWSHDGDYAETYKSDCPPATIVAPMSRWTPVGLELLEPRQTPSQQHQGLGPFFYDGMRPNRQVDACADEKEECYPKASATTAHPLPLQLLLPSSIPLLSASPSLALAGSNRPLYDQLQDMTVNHRCHYGPLLLSSDRSLFLRQPDGATAALLRRQDSGVLSAAAHRPVSAISRAVPTDDRALACRPHHQQRLCLPCKLACPTDAAFLTKFQVFLRLNIEAFHASDDDVGPHKTGRNKRISLHQVGIRCRHCAHVPSAQRKKGAVYFPATTLGFYQAAQNMSSTHFV